VKLGRRRVAVDAATVQRMRAEGLSFKAISQQMGLSVGTMFRAVQGFVAT
jgi:DNA-binding NarL/FixJ family response regulator